mmetsp:Transcript_17414/g.33274  ORF Transcript_17414/g.33274 Transcript_17414/m.33274 type:complete len:206 (-) Transcript_17414:654-1271(-)
MHARRIHALLQRKPSTCPNHHRCQICRRRCYWIALGSSLFAQSRSPQHPFDCWIRRSARRICCGFCCGCGSGCRTRLDCGVVSVKASAKRTWIVCGCCGVGFCVGFGTWTWTWTWTSRHVGARARAIDCGKEAANGSGSGVSCGWSGPWTLAVGSGLASLECTNGQTGCGTRCRADGESRAPSRPPSRSPPRPWCPWRRETLARR